MVLTVLEAHVDPAREADLMAAYADAGRGTIEEGLEYSHLARSRDDPTLWRILTYWRSAEDLRRMRESGATPTGILIFRAAGASPELSVFEVAASIEPG